MPPRLATYASPSSETEVRDGSIAATAYRATSVRERVSIFETPGVSAPVSATR